VRPVDPLDAARKSYDLVSRSRGAVRGELPARRLTRRRRRCSPRRSPVSAAGHVTAPRRRPAPGDGCGRPEGTSGGLPQPGRHDAAWHNVGESRWARWPSIRSSSRTSSSSASARTTAVSTSASGAACACSTGTPQASLPDRWPPTSPPIRPPWRWAGSQAGRSAAGGWPPPSWPRSQAPWTACTPPCRW